MTIFNREPVFVGPIEHSQIAGLGDRIIKILFVQPEGQTFKYYEWKAEIDDAIAQILVLEMDLQGYYTGTALITASPEALKTRAILLAPGQRHWVLGAGTLYPTDGASAGNWSDRPIVIEAKSALAAQMYRLDALLVGASSDMAMNVEARRALVLNFVASRVRPRLEGLLRDVGSRKEGGDWLPFMSELYEKYGMPAIRHLYREPAGKAQRLAIGTQWRREGRTMRAEIGALDKLDAANPFLARDIGRLDFAAELLARTQIQRAGLATAVQQGTLDDDSMASIVDVDSQPDLQQAVEAAMHWNINPAFYFYALGCYRGLLDAARSVGIYKRTRQVELVGLSAYGIRAIMREDLDTLLKNGLVELRRSLRKDMPKELVDQALAAS